MRLGSRLLEKLGEAAAAVLPISVIVLLLGITIVPMPVGTLVLFLFGAILVVLGMVFFTLGADMSMIPMGEGLGVYLSRFKQKWIPLLSCLFLGVLVTVAEPDLQVLAGQVPGVPSWILMGAVALGVGCFLLFAQLRMAGRFQLSHALLVSYGLVFFCSFLAPDSFLAVSFDSGGVTTGPVTVPFLMALGVGMASVRSDKNSGSDSFGLIALCSVGPILSVMLLGILYEPDTVVYEMAEAANPQTTAEAARLLSAAMPVYFKEVAAAIGPILLIFLLFQGVSRRFHRQQVIRILSGFFYTYIGLVLFLAGANVGFMPAGQNIGQLMATGKHPWLLIPVGALMGYFIVRAEPAVQVLCRQVEEVSNGAITQRVIGHSLSAGVAAAVGIGMLRILTGIPVMWFLIPGYGAALLMTFFVPQMFSAVAFDSGGVASGPMTATFVLPLGMGACAALGGDIMTDAFGIVAMVALAPLFTIQMVGLKSRLEQSRRRRSWQKTWQAGNSAGLAGSPGGSDFVSAEVPAGILPGPGGVTGTLAEGLAGLGNGLVSGLAGLTGTSSEESERLENGILYLD